MKESGVVDKILKEKDKLGRIFLYNPFSQGESGEEQLDWAENAAFATLTSFEERKIAREIIDLKTEVDIIEEESFGMLRDRIEELLLGHPSFLTRICLGEEVFSFQNYGFSTRRHLETAVTAFCIGDKSQIMGWDDNYLWRNKGKRNLISLNEHGDLYAQQADTDAEVRREQGLFGEMVEFDPFVEAVFENRGRVNAHQDWSTFLVAGLRYAEALGLKDMDLIVNWREVLEREGSIGTNTAEAAFGGGGVCDADFYLGMGLAGSSSPQTYPIFILNQGITYVPVFEDETLVYYRQEKGGNCDLSYFGNALKGLKFSRQIVYDRDDLPHVLKTTYRYFARDKSLMVKIMDAFNS